MIHPHGYWLEISEANKHCRDYPLSVAIVDMFKNVKSACDLGCGDGAYTFEFFNVGIECKGYDGSPLTPEITAGLCEVLDLSQPFDIGKFELVLSLEVGEHIPKEFEQTFLDNICKTSSKWVCLSWGVPGQPGYGHVNCQTNEYVICEMAKRGFTYDKKRSDKLRKKATFDWFKNTVMIFKNGLE